MTPTLKQLRYFLAAAEQGQFSAAAAVMNVSQSSITLSVKALEEGLGYPLFRRLPQGVELTESGAQFLRNARGLLSSVEDLMSLPPAEEDACPENVRVAVTDTITGYYLPELLDYLRRASPGLDVTLTELPRAEVETRVAAGAFDLGLVLVSNLTLPGLARQTLLRSPRRLWLGVGHPLAAREAVSLKELETQNYLLLQTDDHEATMSRFWAGSGLRPRITLRTQSLEGLRGLVAGGHGVTVLSDMVYRAWSLEGRRILRRPLLEATPTMDTGLIWRRDRPLSRAAERLVDLAVRHAQTTGQTQS